MPGLTFSALGGLPGMASASAAPTSLVTAGNATISQPFSLSTVAEATSSFTTKSTYLGVTGSSLNFGKTAGANQGVIEDPSTASTIFNVTDNAFHAMQGVFGVGASALVINVDNTETSTTGGSGGITTALRIARGNSGFTPDGLIMEAGFWPSGFSSGQRTSMNTNQHSAANGYNF